MTSRPAVHAAIRTQPGLSPRHDSHVIEGDPPARIALYRDASLERLCLEVRLDPASLTLTCSARNGVWHYFRRADGTLKPLPPQPGPLTVFPGDAYIALSPGAQRLTDSPTVARFLHLRDDFNADNLARSLLVHLAELADGNEFPEDVTVLVIEAR
jgi:hypothetical protein